MEDIENECASRRRSQKKSTRMKGLAKIYEPHMLKESHLEEMSYKQIQHDIVARCMPKPEILSISDTADLAQVFGKAKRVPKESNVLKKIVSTLNVLSMNDRSELVKGSRTKNVTKIEMKVWMGVELHHQVKLGIVEDATNVEDIKIFRADVERENIEEDLEGEGVDDISRAVNL